MNFIIFEAVLGPLFLMFVYTYLYFIERKNYFGVWAVSWFTLWIGNIIFLNNFYSDMSVVHFTGNQYVCLLSFAIFIYGTSLFLCGSNKHLLYTTVSFCLPIVLLFDLLINNIRNVSSSYYYLLFILSMFCGVSFLRHRRYPYFSKYIVAISFILLGILLGLTPIFLRIQPELFWYRILPTFLQRSISICFLIMYYQNLRCNLIDTMQSLEKSETHLKDIMNQQSDIILEVDEFDKFIFVSASCAQIGYEADELLGKCIQDFSDIDTPIYFLKDNTNCIWNQLNGAKLILSLKIKHKFDHFGAYLGAIISAQDITEQNNAIRKLRETELMNQAVLSSLSSNIAVLDNNGKIIAVNDSWKQFALDNHGDEKTVIGIGLNYLDVCRKSIEAGSPHADMVFEGISEILNGKRGKFSMEYPCPSPSEERWFLLNATRLSSDIPGVVVSHTNITESKLAQIALGYSEEKYRTLIEFSPNAIIICSSNHITFANQSAVKLLEKESNEQLINNCFLDYLGISCSVVKNLSICDLLTQSMTYRWVESKLFISSEKTIDVELSVIPIPSIEGDVVQVIFRDISERKRNEEILKKFAYYDALTDLPNRLYFVNQAVLKIAECRLSGRSLPVLFIDLDHFKMYNDTLGHNVGDEILKEAGQRLQSVVGDDGMVARIGADEYLIMLYNIRDSKDVERWCKTLLNDFNTPRQIMAQHIYSTLSIGVSSFPTDGNNIDILIRNADVAMCKVKTLGGNNYCVYNSSTGTDLQDHVFLINDLRHGLIHGEFELFYQPRVSLMDNKVCGMEALIRWRHPDLGLIPPKDFIPIAEKTGLIVTMGEFIFRTACRQTKALHDKGFSNIIVAVNISPIQIMQHGIAERILQILAETKLNPECLEIEITETIAVTNLELTNEVIKKLKAAGVRIAMDDFGTGYSSLIYLQSLDINILKIDYSFVKNIVSQRKTRSIAETIIRLAHNLDFEVVAEGVEQWEQLQILKEFRCDYIQGFLFSKPLPYNELNDVLIKSL